METDASSLQQNSGGEDVVLVGSAESLIAHALQVRASDVHIDPVDLQHYRVCYRVDGVIHPQRDMTKGDGLSLVNQFKVAAGFSTDRVFTSLEGRITLGGTGGEREIRVTVLPTTRAEAVHLRLMDPPSVIMDPTELGLSGTALTELRRILQQPEGLMLITGATGAGKTMSLYSLISCLDIQSIIAVSVEDPAEYELPYLRQILVDAPRGLTMQTALRTSLRMDPDAILIGEIRDTASAVSAVRAAAAGRFVLATLHAQDPVTAVEACHHYSIPRYLLASTLRVIISQALVRCVCVDCSTQRAPTRNERDWFAAAGQEVPDTVSVAQGCAGCNEYGYRGRTGLFQVIPMGRTVAEAVTGSRGPAEIRAALQQTSAPSIQQEALRKVAAGTTTLEEIAGLLRSPPPPRNRTIELEQPPRSTILMS